MQRTISFTLNGKPARVTVDDERMLLWVLRYDLGLTGTKFGCGAGCGFRNLLGRRASGAPGVRARCYGESRRCRSQPGRPTANWNRFGHEGGPFRGRWGRPGPKTDTEPSIEGALVYNAGCPRAKRQVW
jgi:hypothetical protein